jgi:hypothetical protein
VLIPNHRFWPPIRPHPRATPVHDWHSASLARVPRWRPGATSVLCFRERSAIIANLWVGALAIKVAVRQPQQYLLFRHRAADALLEAVQQFSQWPRTRECFGDLVDDLVFRQPLVQALPPPARA